MRKRLCFFLIPRWLTLSLRRKLVFNNVLHCNINKWVFTRMFLHSHKVIARHTGLLYFYVPLNNYDFNNFTISRGIKPTGKWNWIYHLPCPYSRKHKWCLIFFLYFINHYPLSLIPYGDSMCRSSIRLYQRTYLNPLHSLDISESSPFSHSSFT